jgi:hypothetical protein
MLQFGGDVQSAEKALSPAKVILDVTELKAVPDGNYLVTLEYQDKPVRLNLRIQGNKAKCVNSSNPMFKDVEGGFQLHQNGSFVGRFQGRTFRGSQLWIFRADGAAAVREIPDRGEQQSAVPVTGSSIEVPKSE